MTKEELYALDFNVKTLGECKIPSMLKLSDKKDDSESFNGSEVIIVDTLTNVLYIWVRSGYGGGITPLLDKDGNIQFFYER